MRTKELSACFVTMRYVPPILSTVLFGKGDIRLRLVCGFTHWRNGPAIQFMQPQEDMPAFDGTAIMG